MPHALPFSPRVCPLSLCSPLPAPKTPARFSSGLSTEGIYRVSGNKSEMESLQRQFDQGKATACRASEAGASHGDRQPSCQWSPSRELQFSPGGAPATHSPRARGAGLVTEKQKAFGHIRIASMVTLPQRRNRPCQQTETSPCQACVSPSPPTDTARVTLALASFAARGPGLAGTGPCRRNDMRMMESWVEKTNLFCQGPFPQRSAPLPKSLHERESKGTFVIS